jgi:Cu/Ag efflux pump CusA
VVDATIETVRQNLFEGAVLVVVVLFVRIPILPFRPSGKPFSADNGN